MCPDREFCSKIYQNVILSGKIGKSGKIGNFSKKVKKFQFHHVFIIQIHVLSKFHEKIMIFEEIGGYLVILPFYRA